MTQQKPKNLKVKSVLKLWLNKMMKHDDIIYIDTNKALISQKWNYKI